MVKIYLQLCVLFLSPSWASQYVFPKHFWSARSSMVKDIVKSVNEGVRAFSIVERLELAKEQLSGEKSESKPLKDTVKKPEMGRDWYFCHSCMSENGQKKGTYPINRHLEGMYNYLYNPCKLTNCFNWDLQISSAPNSNYKPGYYLMGIIPELLFFQFG